MAGYCLYIQDIYLSNPNLKTSLGERDRPVSAKDGADIVELILREEIELAQPDDLGFLESQVRYIACRIAGLLGLQHEP